MAPQRLSVSPATATPDVMWPLSGSATPVRADGSAKPRCDAAKHGAAPPQAAPNDGNDGERRDWAQCDARVGHRFALATISLALDEDDAGRGVAWW